ncbi:MAG: flavodoxin family protein [Desulfobacteraceae bacterium]|jgi:flavodoxin
MKALVTYFTETGNTEKVAQAIYEGIEKVEKDILPLQETTNAEEYDLIFCGFPVHASSVPHKVEPFLKNIPQGKRVAIFATHGSLRKGQLATAAFDYAVSLLSKAKTIGTFGCRGKVKPDLLEVLAKKPEHRAWAEEALGAAAHPDAADLEDAKDFAKKMVKKARSG